MSKSETNQNDQNYKFKTTYTRFRHSNFGFIIPDMKTLLYIGIGLVALLALVALGANADSLPYLGILIVVLLIGAYFFKK